MGKGNPKAYLNVKNNLIAPDIDISEDENKNYISLITESFNATKPDLSKPDEINNAIQSYFDRCYRHNIKPGNMGLYNALGITRQEVDAYLHGRIKAPNPAFIDTLKKAKSVMAEYREVLGAQNKLSPPVLIFWQKNHDGFEDVQRVDVSAVNQLQAEKTQEELAQSVIDDIPQD